MVRRTGVSPALAQIVLARDKTCRAPVLDPRQSGTCWGRLTLEHVTDESRKAKRAEDDEQHLVVLCELHAGLLRTAGEQWNTKKENRYKLRGYLWAHYGLFCAMDCGRKGTTEWQDKWFCEPCMRAIDEGVFV